MGVAGSCAPVGASAVRVIGLIALVSCSARPPSPPPPTWTYGPPPGQAMPAYPAQPVYVPPAAGPPVPRRPVPVRVLGARWQGQLPADERGRWALDEAPNIVSQLGIAARDTGLSFVLESAGVLDVADERFSQIPATQADAISAMQSYAWSGRLTNETLSVVVVSPSRTGWIAGWGQQGHPLRTPGKWPMMIVTTRITRAREAHWIGHELGHVFGFFDSTFYDASPVDNPPYTQCGLWVPSRTYPRASAPVGARQNLMSYDTAERSSYFSAGYETSHRQILDCWIRMSGL